MGGDANMTMEFGEDDPLNEEHQVAKVAGGG